MKPVWKFFYEKERKQAKKALFFYAGAGYDVDTGA